MPATSLQQVLHYALVGTAAATGIALLCGALSDYHVGGRRLATVQRGPWIATAEVIVCQRCIQSHTVYKPVVTLRSLTPIVKHIERAGPEPQYTTLPMRGWTLHNSSQPSDAEEIIYVQHLRDRLEQEITIAEAACHTRS